MRPLIVTFDRLNQLGDQCPKVVQNGTTGRHTSPGVTLNPTLKLISIPYSNVNEHAILIKIAVNVGSVLVADGQEVIVECTSARWRLGEDCFQCTCDGIVPPPACEKPSVSGHGKRPVGGSIQGLHVVATVDKSVKRFPYVFQIMPACRQLADAISKR